MSISTQTLDMDSSVLQWSVVDYHRNRRTLHAVVMMHGYTGAVLFQVLATISPGMSPLYMTPVRKHHSTATKSQNAILHSSVRTDNL